MEVKNYEDILKDLINDFVANQNKITDFNNGGIAQSILSSVAREEEKKYVATKLGFIQTLRAIPYSIFDFKRKEGTFGTGTVIFSRANPKDFETVIPEGTEIAGGGKSFITVETGVIKANEKDSNEIIVRSVEIGSENNIEANIINEIVSSVSSDVVAVTNNIKISGGYDTESELEMLKRFKVFLAGLQGTNTYGVQSAAQNVPGVRSVNVVEDFSPGVIYPVVVYAEDGSGSLADDVKSAIENVIWGDGTSINPGKRAPGINVLVTTPEIVQTNYNIRVTIYRADPETAKEEIKTTVRDYVNSLGIGENVVLTSIILKIRSLTYVRDVSIISPNDNILIANNQIARFNDAEVYPVEE